MPYIDHDRRAKIDPHLNKFWTAAPLVEPGELNYVITRLILLYVGTSARYTLFNSIIGVLECVKQELYRRLVGPYEDEKMEENGDVYHGRR